MVKLQNIYFEQDFCTTYITNLVPTFQKVKNYKMFNKKKWQMYKNTFIMEINTTIYFWGIKATHLQPILPQTWKSLLFLTKSLAEYHNKGFNSDISSGNIHLISKFSKPQGHMAIIQDLGLLSLKNNFDYFGITYFTSFVYTWEM